MFLTLARKQWFDMDFLPLMLHQSVGGWCKDIVSLAHLFVSLASFVGTPAECSAFP